MDFKLKSDYQPAGDQPSAIKGLVDGIKKGIKMQTLLGVTGSGKTFTAANVIQELQRPTLVIAHNKTLAAQLCNEFREFFPDNVVEYFVSYYDYYQPEAYMPRTDTYIEKEAMINQEIDRLRHAATQALLTRRDVIIVASVSCIYGLGSPEQYKGTVLHLHCSSPRRHVSPPAGGGVGGRWEKERLGEVEMSRNALLHRLIEMQFARTTADLTRGHFRARGDVLEIMPMQEEVIYRLMLDGDQISQIFILDPVTRQERARVQDVWIFPAKHYVVSPNGKADAIKAIRAELKLQLDQFDKEGKLIEAERLSRRTRYDLEMIEQVGYCNGIENYSRHFDGRMPGDPPFTLLDYFPDDFLLFIDESHVSVSQIGGMYNGDKARKDTLVAHGFRLPSARDNRPLRFAEFEGRMPQTVFVSATPGQYELEHSAQVVEQIIRPTGLVDPAIDVRPITPQALPLLSEERLPLPEGEIEGVGAGVGGGLGQVDDLLKEVQKRAALNERVLVTTLTKKMAEDLTTFMIEKKIKVQYLHSDIDTLERITVLSDFRKGTYDVLIGVNLLREGLDLPEVTLVAILDADKEGFLRSETSIIQTVGRAARNVKGEVILYADEMTGSMTRAIKETDRRRTKQLAYNKEHNITPKTVQKGIKDIRQMFGIETPEGEEAIKKILKLELTAEPHEIEEVIKDKEGEMLLASRNLDFELAALLRDEIVVLKKELRDVSLRGAKRRSKPKRG